MTVWVLTGPTASGKSSLGLALAERHGLEIVSMDSMAVYRRMDIGTAKPSVAARARVPHHLIDVVEPNEAFDTSRWRGAAEAAVADIERRGQRALFIGGTPLYLMAYFKGLMPGPAARPELRRRLRDREQHEPGSLHRELAATDPRAAARIHAHDVRRLVRALEVLAVTGMPISAQQCHFETPGWRLPCRVVALRRPREELRARVKQRTIAMLDAGLLDEVRAIRQSCGFSPQSGAAIGYAQCIDHLDGRYKDLEELRNRIRRATHGLIRRQSTWLRRLPEIRWLEPASGASDLLAAFEG